MTPNEWFQAFILYNAQHIDASGQFRRSRPRFSPNAVKVALWFSLRAAPETLLVTDQSQIAMAAVFGVQQPNISLAVKRMTEAGWLERVKRGQGFGGTAVYRLTTPPYFWDEYLGALATKAENSPAWAAEVRDSLKELLNSECPIPSGKASQAAAAERSSRSVGECVSPGVSA